MEKTTSHIIKSSQVNLNGAFKLNTAGTIPQSARPTLKPSKPVGPAQARVVEKNNEFAMVEVICTCGEKIPVKCIYASQVTQEDENPNQS
ncbi:MAG: hypothetical protein ACYTFM_07370 [Planctomycetota bacterium]|jgi:hypothetical protein